jgi:nitrate reductase (cytochrome), electron transfer subunit
VSVSGPQRYGRIIIAITLMTAGVFVVGRSLREANAPADLTTSGDPGTPSRLSKPIGYTLERQVLAYRAAPPTLDSDRTLDAFYGRRAYPGAPPPVPHPLPDPTVFGGTACLSCHGDGGWVPTLAAYAPPTPHPDLVSCLQCHVPAADDGATVRTTFEPEPFPIGLGAALPGGPPPIPHTSQMRENCLACHAGPAAVRGMRVTHPERVNCRQCHVAGVSDAVTVFSRPVVGGS